MATNVAATRQQIQQCLQTFDFRRLFVEVLGWDNLREQPISLTCENQAFVLRPVVEKRGVKVYLCDPDAEGMIPANSLLRKIESELTRYAFEHIIIYVDVAKTRQVWQWVKRGQGKSQSRLNRYYKGQSGELLAQKLERLEVAIEEEERIHHAEMVSRTAKAFDVERVTRKFYDRFKLEHGAFLQFIEGITIQGDREWYASLMLNRLMFIYFIQRKGFLDTKTPGALDGDTNYLSNRLKSVQVMQESRRGASPLPTMMTDEDGDGPYHGRETLHGSPAPAGGASPVGSPMDFYTFYRYFLLKLFHDGLSKREHTAELEALLGKVPYLNGGLFDIHTLERMYPQINIPDEAFEHLFDFFNEYDWHLDDRPLRSDREINPDVLGFIFEKYINQKQMGAYYTKEDITEYISKNTILPSIFDATEQKCLIAFKPDGPIWSLLGDAPDHYIYDAVKKGCDLPLPPEIEAGVHDVALRTEWNKPAPEAYALPTEIWREVVARRTRYQDVRAKLLAGEIRTINDLVTYNLDIATFAQDAIGYCEGPELLRAFYDSIRTVSVLDPTCGSGAFLFAALNILESLYEACLDRMQQMIEERDLLDSRLPAAKRQQFPLLNYFRGILNDAATHPNRTYFIYKSIIINNLYGVDIMEEAVEICKLRLFLKLVSQVEQFKHIEPLPDIDFNIRAGNTLVGFASYEETKRAIEGKTVGKGATRDETAYQGQMIFDDRLQRIEQQAQTVERDFATFRQLQTEIQLDPVDIAANKQRVRENLGLLRAELDGYLASEYGIDRRNISQKDEYQKRFTQWHQTHQPFHWWVEFYGIMKRGGFDVIIGNPPYVSIKNVEYSFSHMRKFTDLYGHVLTQSLALCKSQSHIGMIVPLSITFSEDFAELRRILCSTGNTWFSSFDNIPAALFAGVSQRCTIWLSARSSEIQTFVTPMYRWRSEYRQVLTSSIYYTAISASHVGSFGIPKIASKNQVSVLTKIIDSKDQAPRYFMPQDHSGKIKIGYSQSARNFVSVFLENPPYLDESTLEPVPSSKIGYLGLRSEASAYSALAILVGEVYLWYWLVRGDGFDVTGWIVANYLTVLNSLPQTTFSLLAKLGDFLHERRFEALVFKKNAGKYVGNYNYRRLFYLTRRADLLLLAGLGIARPQALEILNYVQRVLSINEQAGEKSIPAEVKSKFSPGTFDMSLQDSTLKEIDRVLAKHYGFTDEELDFIINYDIKYRMGRDSGDEGEE